MIPALRRLREEDGKVELGLGSTVRSHLKPTFSPPPNLMCFRQEPALGLAQVRDCCDYGLHLALFNSSTVPSGPLTYLTTPSGPFRVTLLEKSTRPILRLSTAHYYTSPRLFAPSQYNTHYSYRLWGSSLN